MDDAMDRYLAYLAEEKGRAAATIKNYRQLHNKWFSPKIGRKRVRDVTDEAMDRIAGEMRAAGLSASRLNDVRSLYGPFFRWAKRRGYTRHNPMAEFEVPRSDQVPEERVPPEVEQMCRYLEVAVEVVPDVAPLLTLYAVTSRRRAEITALRRSRMLPADLKLKVDVASAGKTLKPTKNRKQGEVDVDADTMDMLLRHCTLMDERAAAAGVEIAPDAFVFSLLPDCSEPMDPTYVTKRLRSSRSTSGSRTSDRRPSPLDDEALLLRRAPIEREPGRSGPKPQAGMSYEDIGKRLGRSMKWVWNAVRSAERREAAAQGDEVEWSTAPSSPCAGSPRPS